MFAAQESQSVVLLRGKIILPEEFLFQDTEAIVGAPQAEESFLLERIKPAARPDLGALKRLHDFKINHSNNSCPDNLFPVPALTGKPADVTQFPALLLPDSRPDATGCAAKADLLGRT